MMATGITDAVIAISVQTASTQEQYTKLLPLALVLG